MAQDYHGHAGATCNLEFGIWNACQHSKFRIPNSKFPHSCRTASMGSIDAACRAGARQAAAATASNRAVTPLRMSGSRELAAIQREARLSQASDSSTPAASPAPTFHDVAENTMPTTSRALAPRAMRMPNSLVLLATVLIIALTKNRGRGLAAHVIHVSRRHAALVGRPRRPHLAPGAIGGPRPEGRPERGRAARAARPAAADSGLRRSASGF